MSTDLAWIRQVSNVQVMIEEYKLCNFLGSVLEALENSEIELIEECPEFEGSQHQKNLEHQKKIIGLAMSAVDLDCFYGKRNISYDRLKNDIKELEHYV